MTSESRPVASAQPRIRLAARRQWAATVLGLTGVVLLFLGWYGVSGRATIGEQMPYIASGSIPGAALLVSAAVLLASESSQRSSGRTQALMAELHSLLVEEVPIMPATNPAESTGAPDDFVAVPSGEHYHRPGCALAAGKPDAETIDAAAITGGHLTACPVCEPDQPAT